MKKQEKDKFNNNNKLKNQQNESNYMNFRGVADIASDV